MQFESQQISVGTTWAEFKLVILDEGLWKLDLQDLKWRIRYLPNVTSFHSSILSEFWEKKMIKEDTNSQVNSPFYRAC